MKRHSASIATFAYEDYTRRHGTRPLAGTNASTRLPETFENIPWKHGGKSASWSAQFLWDLFSDGHQVIATEDRVLDLGSFRVSGAFLAEILNRQRGPRMHYDYLDFLHGDDLRCSACGISRLSTK